MSRFIRFTDLLINPRHIRTIEIRQPWYSNKKWIVDINYMKSETYGNFILFTTSGLRDSFGFERYRDAYDFVEKIETEISQVDSTNKT